MELLQKLCQIPGTSGNEGGIRDFILSYIEENQSSWKCVPKIIHGDEIQDAVLLVFGKPRTAIIAHIDTIGFTVRYNNQVVPVGSPHMETGMVLRGADAEGEIRCKLSVVEEDDDEKLVCEFHREIERGTELVFDFNFRESADYVQSCYLDNRLGVWSALKVAENLENGIIAFSCWEEHGGGSVPVLARIIFEQYGVRQALISDITWVTEGVKAGQGVAISLRDRSIPRKKFIEKIVKLAKESDVPFQLEVEGAGGSDGKELQSSPYPFDWCFIGAPEDNVHSPDEKVHKNDIESMVALYNFLMKKL
ncbi:MAG: M20/M25/M40 family metallo-hydrolase [Cytophagaceae bacterium]